MSAFPPFAFGWKSAVSRRDFLGVAAAVAATLPVARVWADASDATLSGNLPAIGLNGKQLTLRGSDVKDLRASLSSGAQLLLAQDKGYDQARRVWNGAFDRRPALIARCATAKDVSRAVSFARSHELLTCVKGGGHSISGQSTCDGGLMIDLGLMRDVQVDRAKRAAKAQGGALLLELDSKTQEAGLVTTLGTAADTGIAGLTLGGGQGRLMRAHGLSCDNVLGYEVVTADGKVLQASAKQNPDLFWALRGGGGNFGVVTSFEYQLHPLDHPVLAGARMYPLGQARAVLDALFELGQNAPDELFLSGGITVVEPGSPVPPGKYVAIEAVYRGKPADGEKLIAPLAKLGKPALDTVGIKPYVQAQLGPTGSAPPAMPAGLGFYVKSGFLNTVPDNLVDELVHVATEAPPWFNGIGIAQLGGAVARVESNATAYWNRRAAYDLLMFGVWADHTQDAHNVQVMRELWQRLAPFTKGYYINTDTQEAESRLRNEAYGDNYPRLVQLKNKYDPGNLFRLNANIRPTGKA
jgi:FAD/FMN-containing dehydrogenase